MTPVPQSPQYVELHCHSAYSFLDGVSLPDELAARAAELGHVALALTDHNSVSGSMEMAQAAQECGVKAIHGAEIDLAGDRSEIGQHITLLVRDERGWANLCRIITLAHAHTRDGPARRDAGEPSVALEQVLERAGGLVCLTGCAGRSVVIDRSARRSPSAGAGRSADRSAGRFPIGGGGGGAVDEAVARRLLEAFGSESLRVELQRPYARHDRARNRALSALARRLQVACVATGNVHAHAPCRAELQDAFVALREHSTLDASEPLRRGNHSHVLSTPAAMASRFADHPEAVAETLVLAEQLAFDLTKDLGYRYPGAEDRRAGRRLSELCAARLEDRFRSSSGRARALARLEEELAVIRKLGLAGFFLLHHDMLELAREVAVEVRGRESVRGLLAPGRGRGSSVSSLVCYLIGLSHIDPIANELALGRFLHEDLRGLPDIDLDFPRDVREVLIPRVHDRYGRDCAALVAAFPTFRARGAIRELGKVLGLPAASLERLARGAEIHYAPDRGHDAPEHGPISDRSVLDGGAPEAEAAVAPTSSPRWRWLERLVGEAYGLPRHLSQHPGGMIVATRPLIDCCPVVPAAMEGRQMVQWDKDSCADAGFLKIDLLGLGMLSAVERCVEEIARVRGERIDLSRIPYDDPDTFAAIRTADTVGVFQIESRAQMQSLRRTQPANLSDLTVQVAIIRPGPIQGGAVNPYIERRRRLREDPGFEIPYDHPALEGVLADTLGTIIFQDQVMEVAEVFAGFGAGEADGLRRAMSRKRSAEMLARHRERFIEGAQRHVGADARTAERVWQMVEGFAGFGFPKAHSAAFGLLAYQSTWLRVHYGPELLCALLNEQPMGFYAPDSLVHEAAHRGIEVLPLDVNASQVQCAVQGSAVRLGLGYIKGAASAEVQALVAERERGGPFTSLADLASRSGAARGALEQLAWSGACWPICWPISDRRSICRPISDRRSPAGEDGRRAALWQLGIAVPAATAGEGTQLSLPLGLGRAPRLPKLGRWQRLIADYATSGVTVSDHAIAILRPRLRVPGRDAVSLATSAQLPRLPSGCAVAVAGLVIARQRPGTAKGTMFLLFEDEWGTVNLIVSAVVYERHRHLARAEPLLLARGRLERAEGVINVIVRELAPLERYLAPDADGPLDASAQASVHPLRPPAGAETAAEAPAESDAATADSNAAEVGSSMRAVAPPVTSFAMGRRR
ncbi:MAG TPA: DNA polymerase III subunit alpha [Solirubrobacteraceae bacterium]|nr:DNA polymerase III subunit alpha [Solirubrobacteraceae bacterium]